MSGSDAAQDRAPSWRGVGRRWIAFPALAAAVLATADVTSLSFSTRDLQPDGSSTGTVTATANLRGTVMVKLASSKPSVAIVPSSVSVGRTGRATFRVSAVPGAAGCTFISARTGTTPARSELLFVHAPFAPEAPLRLTLSPSSVVGSATATGIVTLDRLAGENHVVTLASDNPAVTVPASVEIPLGRTSATFPVSTGPVSPSTCAVITATFGTTARALLKVFSIGG